MKNDLNYIADSIRAWLSTTPKTQCELARLVRQHPRTVRKAIGVLRDNGVKVCSGPAGFWIWDGEDDSWSKTKRTIRKKAISTLRRYYAMEGLPLDGQISIEEVLG